MWCICRTSASKYVVSVETVTYYNEWINIILWFEITLMTTAFDLNSSQEFKYCLVIKILWLE